jgi:hypothetical protein
MGCFVWILLVMFSIFVMLSFIRWFEQTAEAVDNGWWNKIGVLIAMPFMVWYYPSRVSAGRPTPVPRHVPVRGFGSVPLRPKESTPTTDASTTSEPPLAALAPPTDGPSPGTPKEFLGMPVIPPKKKSPKAAVDPEKLEKLRQKMREQGMLDE